MSQSQALRLVAMARSSWHYRHQPRPRVAEPKPHTQRRSRIWITPAEEARILDRLADPRYADLSIGAAFIKTLDAGIYIASMRTWYRVAARHGLKRPTSQRRRATRPSRAVPEQVARAVNELWSWDITKLPTPLRGQSYEFYVVLDVYSRRVVAYRVEEAECDLLARDMFREAITRLGAKPRVVHSDGGPSMTSDVVADFLSSMNITRSKNRPRVSNDNPYSEAGFKTAKYRPDYPQTFDSLEHARAWADAFVQWYNNEHQHSGIGWHTPIDVYTGNHHAITARRQATLDRHYQTNTHRHRTPPQAPALPIEAWINNPKKRLQTD
jgi:putative transposase